MLRNMGMRVPARIGIMCASTCNTRALSTIATSHDSMVECGAFVLKAVPLMLKVMFTILSC
jgi:hypothetical protein